MRVPSLSRECGNPANVWEVTKNWFPACAGMTKVSEDDEGWRGWRKQENIVMALIIKGDGTEHKSG